ncbi:MAG: hypothetical protein DRM98_06620 [Thermoplasmata archaeon]|nr:MAG: hypothetical protein DRM98_06620 [Thermoplasmata archaeon]
MTKLEDIYNKLEQQSLQRHKTAGKQLTVSNNEIRNSVKKLLKNRDKVLLSAIVKFYVDNKVNDEVKKNDKNIYRKVRMRVVTALNVKDSDFKLVKDSGNRVWIRQK